MDQQQFEAGLAATSLATTTVVERKIGGWPCVVRVRSGDRGEPNSALRRWRDGRVPGRCDRVRARASRRNGPGRRVPGQAGHGCGRSRWPGRGCDALRGAAGRRGHRAPGHTGPAVWAPPNRPRFRRGLRAAALDAVQERDAGVEPRGDGLQRGFSRAASRPPRRLTRTEAAGGGGKCSEQGSPSLARRTQAHSAPPTNARPARGVRDITRQRPHLSTRPTPAERRPSATHAATSASRAVLCRDRVASSCPREEGSQSDMPTQRRSGVALRGATARQVDQEQEGRSHENQTMREESLKMNRKPQAGTWTKAGSEALKGHWMRWPAGRRPAEFSRAGAQRTGGSGSTPAPPMTGRRGGVAGCNRAGTRFRRLAAWVLVAIAASAFGTPALANSHCDETDTNELLCATMTVAVSGNNTGFQNGAGQTFGSLSDDEFTVASATQRIWALSYNTNSRGTGARNDSRVLSRDLRKVDTNSGQHGLCL